MRPAALLSGKENDDRSAVRRRQLLLFAASVLLASREGAGRAEGVAVPVELQAELLAKVAVYDRNMPGRAGDRLQVLLLTNGSDPESARFATRMQVALQAVAQIGGFPHDDRIAAFAGPLDLAQQCRARRIGIVFVGPGLGEQVGDIRDALDGLDVLSVAAVPEYVPQGVVLGFDVISGKPKLLVHLTRARRQHVELTADVLKLMRVFE
jgi:hypothetical protein